MSRFVNNLVRTRNRSPSFKTCNVLLEFSCMEKAPIFAFNFDDTMQGN
jgi:hypothetical protein